MRCWKFLGDGFSGWQRLKREPRKPTNKEIRSYLQHLKWLKGMAAQLPDIKPLPVAKREQFANEARALDAAKMARLEARKRYALVVTLIHHQYAQSLDDTAELLVKMVQQLASTAEQHLQTYQLEQRQRTDRLVSCFRSVLMAMEVGSNAVNSVQTVVGEERQYWLDECEEHLAYAGNNYLPFMLRPFRAKRSLLYNCLEILEFQSTSSDPLSMELIRLLKETRRLKVESLIWRVWRRIWSAHFVALGGYRKNGEQRVYLDANAQQVHRKYFELAVFTLIKQELKSGDLFVAHSDRFDDYREHLVDWDTYAQEISQFERRWSSRRTPKSYAGISRNN